MIALFIASASLLTGSFLLVTAAGLPRPHRLSGTLVLSLAVMVVMSILMGALHRYEAVSMLAASVAYVLVAALTSWLLRRHRRSHGAPAEKVPSAPAVQERKLANGGIGLVANFAFGLLLLANVAEYAWRAVLALRLPPLGYDALYYHLINIVQWVRYQALVDPFIGMGRGSRDPGVLVFADSFPKNAELVGGWIAVFTRSMAGVGMTQILFVLMLGISVTGVCRAVEIRADVARVAGALACLCPAVVAQSDQLYVDIARAAPIIAAFQFVLVAYSGTPVTRVSRSRLRLVALPLAGLALGFAVGVKPTNLLFVPILPLVALGLSYARARIDRATGRAPDAALTIRTSSLALLLGPATAIGSYWYLRSWVSWGSPFWPYATGPFGGRSSLDYAGLLESSYGTDSPVVALLKSWWAATSLYDELVLGDQMTGGLGLFWLVAGIPAVVLLLLRSRWNPRAAFALVLPLAMGTLVSPAAFVTRYSILLAVCGVVSLAAVLDAGVAGRWRRASPTTGPSHSKALAPAPHSLRRSARLGVVGFTAIVALSSALALSDAWAATRLGNWYDFGNTERVISLQAEIDTVRAAAPERGTVGYMGEYAPTMQELDPRESIAFFADQPPLLSYPLLGPDLDRDLVVLPAPTTLRGAVSAAAAGLRYLYLPFTESLEPSSLETSLLAQGAKLVGFVVGGYIYDLSPPPVSYESVLPQRDEVSAALPEGSTTAGQPTADGVIQGVSPALTGGCGGNGVGSAAAAWQGQAPYALTAAACEFTNDLTPDRLATTIINELYTAGYALTYTNDTGLTALFERETDGILEAVVIVRLWNRLAIVDVTTVPNKHGALVDIAVNVTERFMAIG